MITIFTDGGARGNPGPAGAGAVIYNKDNTLVAKVSIYLGKQTNNWAEYEAAYLALRKAKEVGLAEEPIQMKLDSKLVVEQLAGTWKVKEPALKLQWAKVTDLIAADFAHVTFAHIPREKNAVADELANDAMDRGK